MLDNIYRWNVRGVLRTLHDAEVINVFFRHLACGLILDLRYDEGAEPLIMVDTLASGPDDRIARLKQQRPRLAAPENVTLAPWYGSVRSFESRGALGEIASRLQRLGYTSSEERLNAAYAELLELERLEAWSLIRGDVKRTQTLYQR